MKCGGELKRKTPLQARTPMQALAGLKPSTKRMRQSRSTSKPTAAESARIVLVKRLGCICCMLNREMGKPTSCFGPCEAHHLLSGGIRRGHAFTIGLGLWHHQGQRPHSTIGTDITITTFGPSVATGSKAFHEMYGTDDELLEFQNALLEQATSIIAAAEEG